MRTLRTILALSVVGIMLAIAALAPPAVVKADCAGGNVLVDPYAFETITVADASIGFTASKYAPTNERRAGSVLITVEAAPLRWRADGTAPTSTVGHLADSDSILQVCGATAIRNWRGIRTGSTSATLRVTYFRAP